MLISRNAIAYDDTHKCLCARVVRCRWARERAGNPERETRGRERMLQRIIRAAVVAVALACAASSAVAGPFNYGDFIGVNPGDLDFLQVRENSITDPGPLYEAPILVNNRLIFTPLAFSSFAANGLADTTSGTLSMRIRADMGQFLKQIIIRETGDATLFGVGNAATGATINGLMTLTDINPGTHSTITSQLTVDPPAPYRLPDDSFVQFSAVTIIDLTGMNISEVVLMFNNNLQTSSQPGTTAFIQKNTIIIETPEPATIGLLGFGSLLLLRRRRRSAC